jgi:DNA-binding helix-hairpin-helix protein with protein kinase domain
LLKSLESKQQLEQYLENFFIEHATIPGIGPGRKATLESYGIGTAADVDKQKIVAVPGTAYPALERPRGNSGPLSFLANAAPLDPTQPA